ncbi:helix-turn-helix domain-containing protein [Candidatus Eisenbacteria bacterium]|uniref:Helix-turn-helix domain-containing protein n=1 Tax=Eiseniibacteriota bacterium TaxID=2212470 RepID=A0ABV6YJB2_UNCEI
MKGKRREEQERLLTVKEVAAWLRCKPQTVYDLVARRAIPHRRLGRRILFEYSGLLRWFEAGKEG